MKEKTKLTAEGGQVSLQNHAWDKFMDGFETEGGKIVCENLGILSIPGQGISVSAFVTGVPGHPKVVPYIVKRVVMTSNDHAHFMGDW